MIKVIVVLECEFESARGSAMLLAMVAKPIKSLDFFQIGLMTRSVE